MNLRSSSYAKVEYLETETFFENKKEKEPFVVIGLGNRDTLEEKFLSEFSKIPSSPFVFYILEE